MMMMKTVSSSSSLLLTVITTSVMMMMMTLTWNMNLLVSAQTFTTCSDYPTIIPGIGLQDSCNEFCMAPSIGNITDHLEGPDPNTGIVTRVVNCNCTADIPQDEWRCTDRYPVWNVKENYTKLCEDLNITSDTSCELFCQETMTPFAFESASGGGIATYCNCGEGISICGSSATTSLLMGQQWMTVCLLSVVVVGITIWM